VIAGAAQERAPARSMNWEVIGDPHTIDQRFSKAPPIEKSAKSLGLRVSRDNCFEEMILLTE